MFFLQINKDIYGNLLDVESLKKSLKNKLENQFGMGFGVTAIWLTCGLHLKNPLENVIFYKRPICDDQLIMLDDTPYHNLYPMNE